MKKKFIHMVKQFILISALSSGILSMFPELVDVRIFSFMAFLFVGLFVIADAFGTIEALRKRVTNRDNMAKPATLFLIFSLFVQIMVIDYFTGRVLNSAHYSLEQSKSSMHLWESIYVALAIHFSIPLEAQKFKDMIETLNTDGLVSATFLLQAFFIKVYEITVFSLLGAFFWSTLFEKKNSESQTANEEIPMNITASKEIQNDEQPELPPRRTVHTKKRTFINIITGKSKDV